MNHVSRRTLLGGIGASGAATFVGPGPIRIQQSTSASTPVASPPVGDDLYAAQVDAGLAYFRARTEEQIPLVQSLLAAIQGGDIEAARAAYVTSRPPYEEIEVLAASFPETDAAIDARPYAFDDGETSAGFAGFHRIETLIYRDEDLAGAERYSEDLVASIETLLQDLQIRENFSASLHFEGMIALANEVASKKISSEEETWSDQSLLIFRHNWLGIASQYEPFAAEVVARNAAIATEVTAATDAALATVLPFFTGDAAVPYSTVSAIERGAFVRASYRLRDALVAARDTLELT